MENKEKKKQGFFAALTVFFCCAIVGSAIGLWYDALEIGATLGTGIGLIWMGVAYFNQKE